MGKLTFKMICLFLGSKAATGHEQCLLTAMEEEQLAPFVVFLGTIRCSKGDLGERLARKWYLLGAEKKAAGLVISCSCGWLDAFHPRT